MNRRIAKFEKVSFEQFLKDTQDTYRAWNSHVVMDEEKVRKIYDNIKLPRRATAGSAGYDFFSPVDFVLMPNETIKIPTGIKCIMNEGWVLQMFPRSGLGFKYRIQLDNTVGIIDSDYDLSDNEGHIFIKITNDSKERKEVSVEAGSGIAQGIFLEYGITVDDDATAIRNGGFGSTDKKERQ